MLRVEEQCREHLVLEASHHIIGIPHEDDGARGLAPTPLLRPEVEDVVQVDVGQQRGHNPTLGSSGRRHEGAGDFETQRDSAERDGRTEGDAWCG